MPKKHNTVAVVIPVRNEAEGLDALLGDVFAQEPLPDEVVVADAGSTDGTAAILEAWGRREPRLCRIEAPGAMPGRGRNLAVAAARSEIIVQIDGGCRVSPGWLASLVRPLLEDRADFVTGKVLPMPIPAACFGRPYDLSSVLFAGMQWLGRSERHMAGGASVAYRRELWERAGGQPDWLRAGEDVLFAKKVRSLGIRHTYAEDSVSFWQAGPTLRQALRRKVRYVMASLEIRENLGAVGKIGLRTLAAAFLIGLSFFRLPALGVLAAGAALFWGRNVAKAWRRYALLSEEKNRLPFLPRLLVLGTASLGWILAEHVGLFLGLAHILRDGEGRARLKQYKTG
ncbi:MAG: glycosyltransferase [Planctomycetota bacterium]